MQNIRKQTKKVSIWKTIGIIYNLALIAFVIWFIASWVNVTATNLPNTPEVPAAWNFFEIIFKIF